MLYYCDETEMIKIVSNQMLFMWKFHILQEINNWDSIFQKIGFILIRIAESYFLLTIINIKISHKTTKLKLCSNK